MRNGEELRKNLDAIILNEIQGNANLNKARDILMQYKRLGISSSYVANMLENIRKNSNEEEGDFILEILDVISGFCSPTLRVW